MKCLVMCNQAADLDSIACCVSLAVSYDATSFIPIPREDLHLRREAEWLLDKCGVDTASLAFSGELDPAEADQIVLVDHNVLPAEFAFLTPKVTEIIDHHKDEFPMPVRKTIEATGSCASLVGRLLMERGTSLPPPAAKLLLGAILIDTRCLASRHPTTPLDREVAGQLAAVAGCDSRALYDELWRLKSDLSVFSPRELLRKDYKEVAAGGIRCGFCAIYGTLESISGPLMKEAEVFRQSRQLAQLAIMSAYYEGDTLRKELALLPKGDLNNAILAYLNDKGAQLEPKCIIDGIQVYNQKNTDWSRKQILPLIKEMLD